MDARLIRCTEVMEAAGLPDLAVRAFHFHFHRLLEGHSGKLSGRDIEPVTALDDAERAIASQEAGRRALSRLGLIKLNGGLGTSMGLEKAKSLLPVKDGLTFLDLIARQVLDLRRRTGCPIPLVFMNSFRTAGDTEAFLERYPALAEQGLPLGFLQHKVPRILADTLEPAPSLESSDRTWCPPGHGDVYTALASTGLLDAMVDRGMEYALISNADNLGAVVDPSIFGYMVEQDVDFLMEVADRTDADRKGGHLCRLPGGRLTLRESAQCPDDETEAFQDIATFRYFNTNTIWVDLRSLQRLLADHEGVLPLDTIVNHKRLDPKQPDSPAVVQLETAMGAALPLFANASAIRVPRHRFSPVKTTNDLLGVRSNAYEMAEDFSIRLHPSRSVPPTIDLDPTVFAHIDDLDQRFPSGPPDLRACDTLTVRGNVHFGENVRVIGAVTIRAGDAPVMIEDGRILRDDIDLS